MAPRILPGGIPRYLLQFIPTTKRFSRSSKELWFFFHFHLFDGFRFQYSQVLVIFLFSGPFDFYWFGFLFLSLFAFDYFSLWVGHIFLCQTSFQYLSRKFLFVVSVSNSVFILFKQFAIAHVHVKWLNFSFVLVNSWPPVHFLSMGFYDITAIINSIDENVSSWK